MLGGVRPAAAQYFGIRLSPHDFSPPEAAADGVIDFGEMCAFCHAPPGSEEAGPPTRTDTPRRYRRYSSSTADMPERGTLSPVSMACLSCHDGTVATGVHLDGFANLGADLRDDHPISVVYDPEVDPALRSGDDVVAAGLKLFREGGAQTVECATCHNPHDPNTARPFLRVSNEGSGLCLTCHIK